MNSTAIVLGFLQGTWDLVDGLNRLITDHFLRFHQLLAPLARFPILLVALGGAWMLAGNLYLFRNSPAQRNLLLALAFLSLSYGGWLMLLPLVQLALLLLPRLRRETGHHAI